MTERPILFSADMVNAILRGEKTVTRRPVKIQPPNNKYKLSTCVSTTGDKRNEGKHQWVLLGEDGYSVIDGRQPYFRNPYGRKGDRLWVRETWGVDPDYNTTVYFRGKELDGIKKRPSIHMPRWAANIILEITDIRIEYLQEINEEDAVSEGVEFRDGYYMGGIHPIKGSLKCWPTAVMAFKAIWNDIYGDTVNRLVWRIAFRKLW